MPDTLSVLFEVHAPWRGKSSCESTETVNRAEAGGGAARSAARTRPPQEPTRHGRGACRLTGSGRSVGRKHEKEKPQGGGERGPRPRRSPGLALGSTGAAPHARLALDLQDGGAGDASCREIPAAQAIVTRRAETRRTFDHSRGAGAGSQRQGRGLLARRETGRARFGAQAGAAGRSLEYPLFVKHQKQSFSAKAAVRAWRSE